MRGGPSDATLSQQSCPAFVEWGSGRNGPRFAPRVAYVRRSRMGLPGSREGKKLMEERRASYDYEDLLACGRGELFGAGNAQLPLPPMLMFDRISDIAEVGGEHSKGLV